MNLRTRNAANQGRKQGVQVLVTLVWDWFMSVAIP